MIIKNKKEILERSDGSLFGREGKLNLTFSLTPSFCLLPNIISLLKLSLPLKPITKYHINNSQ